MEGSDLLGSARGQQGERSRREEVRGGKERKERRESKGGDQEGLEGKD